MKVQRTIDKNTAQSYIFRNVHMGQREAQRQNETLDKLNIAFTYNLYETFGFIKSGRHEP